MDQIDLYKLPKDVLVKLIATIQQENIIKIKCLEHNLVGKNIYCSRKDCRTFYCYYLGLKCLNCLKCYKYYCTDEHKENHECIVDN